MIFRDGIKSLAIPDVLKEMILKHSLNKKQILSMKMDDLAFILECDFETAKIIQSSIRNSSNKSMLHEMTELA
jgi:PIN domain nuclease of toxin-antitoxin system